MAGPANLLLGQCQWVAVTPHLKLAGLLHLYCMTQIALRRFCSIKWRTFAAVEASIADFGVYVVSNGTIRLSFALS